MWFSRRYWRVGVLDQCSCWKKTTISSHAICCSCCLLQFELCRVQIKQCFTYETSAAYQCKFRSEYPEPCEHLHVHVKSLSVLIWMISCSAWKPSLCFETNTRFTVIPHNCAEYFWLSAAKVWTQPFIILSQGGEAACFLSAQTPRDADASVLHVVHSQSPGVSMQRKL